jgi:putative PIN family toxin of toxin-antitoxin system
MSPRVVLDTNILVSGLLGGTATEVIRKWRAGAFDLILSEEIIAEYTAVLIRPKFGLARWVIEELLGYIREKAEWVVPSGEIAAVARDPSDNMFLEAAVSGRADWIVSGDNDLLHIGEFEGIPIISAGAFLPLV